MRESRSPETSGNRRRAPGAGSAPGPGLRLAAFSLYDFADSGFATTIVTVLFSQYYAGVVAGPSGARILGRIVPGAALYAWLTSISMAVVAAAAPFLGVLADRRGSRVLSLAAFWIPGVALTFALAGVGPGEWAGGGLIFVVAYACFATASIFYNALLPEVGPPERLGRISGIAWGVGYLGGALLLVLNLIMLRKPSLLGFAGARFSVQDCFASAAWWWLLFTLPLLWVFRYEARPPSGRRGAADFRAEAREVWREVRRTAGRIARAPGLRRYFLAYLFYNDGVQTVVATASIFGAQALGMSPEQLIGFFLLIQGTAFAGSLVLGWFADRAGHKPVLLVSTGAWALFTIWAACIGLFGDAVREYWVLGGAAGLFLGGIQSCSRSMIAAWIPPGRESEFFGFFSIVSRVASIFGPLLYGALVLATGSLRRAIFSVTLFFLAGGILLAGVRPGRIEEEREALAAGEE